jgi:biopolymer transport protein ExbD
MKLPRPPIRRARIEIIPMIDTIFFLLVFFMIASLTMIRMRAIAIALPKPAALPLGGSQASFTGVPGGDLILTMSAKGEYFVGKQRIGTDANGLQPLLVARFSGSTPHDVVLNFAKNRTTQEMIAVMDIINRSNIAAGRDVPVLVATSPIDQEGRSLSTDASVNAPEGNP